MDYIEKAWGIVNQSVNDAHDEILDTAQFMSDIMTNDGVIHLYGVEHDYAYSMELGYRAGGLVQYHQMSAKELTLRGVLSETEFNAADFYDRRDIAEKFWGMYQLTGDNDALMLYVTKNVYNLTLDVATIAKDRGYPIILVCAKEAILSGEYKENAEALIAMSDKVLDIRIPNPDLIQTVDGIAVCQVANLVGNIFAQSLTMEIYRILVAGGHDAPVLWSANIVGADEHNRAITAKFEGRWNA